MHSVDASAARIKAAQSRQSKGEERSTEAAPLIEKPEERKTCLTWLCECLGFASAPNTEGDRPSAPGEK